MVGGRKDGEKGDEGETGRVEGGQKGWNWECVLQKSLAPVYDGVDR